MANITATQYMQQKHEEEMRRQYYMQIQAMQNQGVYNNALGQSLGGGLAQASNQTPPKPEPNKVLLLLEDDDATETV
jgi:hypothetical protein